MKISERHLFILEFKELCIDNIKQLGKLKNAILHSDCGSQYTSTESRKELNQLGIIQSLSSTGLCYDNARMENFFATLKKEKIYRIPTYKMTRKQVKRIIFRYIFCYSIHSGMYTSSPR